MMTSGELVVTTDPMVKELPLVHEPVNPPLASTAGEELIVKDCDVPVSAAPVVVGRFSHLPEQAPVAVLPR